MWSCAISKSRRTSRYTAISRAGRTFSSGWMRRRKRSISPREPGRRLDFFHLLRMPGAVQAEEQQPLVAVEFAQSHVRLEVTAQVALCGGGEIGSSPACFAEFG